MAARKPTPKAAAKKAAATPPPVVVDKDATEANVKAAQEQAEADAKAADELAAKEKAEADAKAAEEAAFQAEKVEDEREYLVSEPLLHNGDSYKPGDYIYLTRGFAESLKAKGIITNAGE